MILYIPKTDACDWYEELPKADWTTVKKLVANPTTKYLHKDDVSLWAFYNPIECPVIGYYKKPKFITDNFKNCYCLLMDFDDGLPIDIAIEKMGNLTFALYTSYRHTPEHHKYRMVIPLKTPFDHTLMRVPAIKQWFINRLEGVDVGASIKTLQKHKIPAHHPDDKNYRYHINEGELLELPEDLFDIMKWQHTFSEQKFNKKKEPKSIWDTPIDKFTSLVDKNNGLENHHRKELQAMSWKRGSGNDVHGTLCRIAYSLQKADLDFYDIIMDYAPQSYASEIKRMRIR